MSLIACVPNISEGRDQSIIQEIAELIDSVRGIRMLDITSDEEHNRTVYTFVGKAATLRRTVDLMVDAAIRKIDLSAHAGVYPRIGAVDVLPFVPLLETPIEKAAKLAEEVAEDLSEKFGIPTYLYNFAAKSENRKHLRNIREGEFEGFFEKIKKPEWQPDFGPARVHPTAGVIAVGARYPIVALNALIETEDRSVVEEIAESIIGRLFDSKDVRFMVTETHEFAGFKIAVTIRNYKKVSLHQLVGVLRGECDIRMVNYRGTELVGLVTGDALFDVLDHSLALQGFNPMQILDFHVRRK